jgi:hypothetical protein
VVRRARGPFIDGAAATIAASFYTVFVIKRVDEKFRYAPNAALELSSFGEAVVGSLVFFCLAVRSRILRVGVDVKRLRPSAWPRYSAECTRRCQTHCTGGESMRRSCCSGPGYY